MQAGDAIVKVADGPERLTIADVDALLYLPGKSRAMLERALRVPALSEGWKGSFRELLAKAEGRAAAAGVGRASGRCASPRSGPRARPSPRSGSWPTTTRPGRPSGGPGPVPDACACGRTARRAPLTRSYSLSDLPGEQGYRISVKRDGAASRWLHEHVKVGDRIDAAAPRGSFVLRDGTRPVVLISAGVGATPVLAMLHALAREPTTRPVWWLHGARNREEHAFAAEADALLAALPRRPPRRRLQPPGGGGRARRRLRRRRAPRSRDPRARRVPRRTPTTTSAAPTPSCARSAPRSRRTASSPSASPPRRSARSPSTPRGSCPGRRPGAARARRPARHRADRHVRAQRRRRAVGRPLSRACSTSPTRATCPSGSAAASASATTARAACSPARSTYDPDPLEPPPEGRILVCCSRPASELTLDL